MKHSEIVSKMTLEQNGVYSSQNEWLQEKVLRDEWGFDGLIVTDWGASVDRVSGLECGTDLEMTGWLKQVNLIYSSVHQAEI